LPLTASRRQGKFADRVLLACSKGLESVPERVEGKHNSHLPELQAFLKRKFTFTSNHQPCRLQALVDALRNFYTSIFLKEIGRLHLPAMNDCLNIYVAYLAFLRSACANVP
jgi:hypothetical protein